jgi:2'-5' RNA ligase
MARLRTFIAVDLAEDVRDRLLALQEKLNQTGTDVKWVEPENLHVTLLFLGEVVDRDLHAICKGVAEACAELPAFPMTVEKLACFGNPRRPRTLWVGVGEGQEEMVALHDALEPPLLDLGCYRREDRPYTPHITLGRVKSERATEDLVAALTKHASWRAGAMQVDEVRVMSSELTPEGPEYTVLSRVPLK